MRLFVGIELPETIADDLAALEVPLEGVRWIEQQDFHLTLRFVGDVEKSIAYELDEALLEIDMPAFEIDLAGVGFLGGQEPKALVVQVAPNAALLELHRAVDRAAQRVGIRPDARGKFRPHVTIARLKSPDLDRLARYLERHGLFRTPPVYVTRFALFSSKPHTGGGPYVVEQAYDLRHYGDFSDDREGG